MPNSYASFATATEEYAGPPVPNSPYVETNGGQFPFRFLEIAPGYGPNDTNPVWVNIAADVTQIQPRRGRQRILSRFEAGTMTVTIDNKSGKYSPFNPASPYYNQIVPGMPIRFRALWGSVIYPQYSGFVESWPLVWPSANDSTITVTAVDAMKFLNLKKATSINAYAPTVMADGPVAYYKFDEAVGSTTAADSSGSGYTLTKRDFVDESLPGYPQGATYAFQQPGPFVADPAPSFFAGHREITWKNVTLGTGFPANFTIEAWVKLSGWQQQTIVSFFDAFHGGLTLGTDANGYANFNAPTYGTIATSFNLIDDRWHHVAVTMTTGFVAVLYIDGVQYGQVTGSGTFAYTGGLYIGGQPTLGDASLLLEGSVTQVAIYTKTLTGAQIHNHYNAGVFPRQLETTGQRIGYLAGYTGIPTSNQVIDTGQSTVQGATDKWLTGTILANMQDQADTEGGALFIDAAGRLTSFDRLHTSLSPYSSVSLVLGDSPLGNAVSLRLPGTAGNYESTPDSAAVSLGANLLTANQSGIETSVGDWINDANATVARDATQALDGTASLSLTSLAAGNMSARFDANQYAVTPLASYTISFSAKSATVARVPRISISWFDASHGFISNSDGSGTTTTTAGWTASRATYTAPGNAAFANVVLGIRSTAAASEVHYFDRVSVVQGTGDHTIIAKLTMPDWTPAAAMSIASKENPSTQRAYMFQLSAGGALFVRISPDGSSAAFSGPSTVVNTFVDGTAGWVAYSWRASDGRTQFFVSTDGTTWSQLGANVTINAGSVFDSPSLLTIGARGDTGANDPLNGDVSYVEFRNGLATLSGSALTGGTVVASFDATKVTPSTATAPTTYTSPTGETWMANGAGWSWITATPEEPYRLDSLTVSYDDQDVYNEITITPEGLAPQTASDTTSQTQYGKRTQASSSLTSSVADAAARAAARLALFKAPLPRVDAVTVNPTDDPTMLFGPVLGFDLLTRVEVRRRPKDGSGSMFDQTALIEGIEHKVTKATWETTWRLGVPS